MFGMFSSLSLLPKNKEHSQLPRSFLLSLNLSSSIQDVMLMMACMASLRCHALRSSLPSFPSTLRIPQFCFASFVSFPSSSSLHRFSQPGPKVLRSFTGLSLENPLHSIGSKGDRKDQKTLERLHAERQAKIDELKERTNYYTTQQLIQRYDPDPAAKAAAATVLASKLGADSGLKLYVGDESKINAPSGKSNDVEFVQSSGLRNRKQPHTKSSSAGSTILRESNEEMPLHLGTDGTEIPMQNQPVVVEHHPTSTTHDGGWIARIAALLVGEDPTQSYALICGNCHMHNGLARKEDFPYITYYCPHCHALNRSQQLEEHVPGSSSTNMSSPTTPNSGNVTSNASDSVTENKLTISNSTAVVESTEGIEKIVAGGST